jgi:hypothetical protein
MNVYIFGLSLIVGWIGSLVFFHQVAIGRLTRYTRWADLTNLQWTCVYMMTQFVAVLIVNFLYLVFKG